MKRIREPSVEMVLVGKREISFGGMNGIVAELILTPNSRNVVACWEQLYTELVLQKDPDLSERIAARYARKTATNENDGEVFYKVTMGDRKATLDFYI